jgi:kynureninase
LREAGFRIVSPQEAARRGGTVVVSVPEFEAVHRELAERAILCDFRPDVGLRLGPHFFTSDEELQRVVVEIGEIVRSGAHRRHAGATARF